MDYFNKKQCTRIVICLVLVAAIALAVTGVFSGGKQLEYQDKSAHADEGTEAGGEAQNEILLAIMHSMDNEAKNDYVTDYLKQDPYLVNIYEGYGFAKDYGSARSHAYTLDDVQKTERPHAKANCLTCKTPDMHKLIAEQGVSVYSMPFEDVMAQTTNTISCYTCHGADDGNNGQMVVTHQYVNEALGENVSTINAASLSCGQCHIEYYFTPEDSEAMMPYHSVEEMTPEAILAYYDGIGFSDWEQPGTGTKMLKAQHPELETWIQGKHASILSCADCHMPVKTTESGIEYHDHHLVSPLSSEAILNKCAECHGSGEAISARVREIQAKVTGRETEVGNRLSALKDTLTKAVEDGKMSEEELDAVRKLHREAQWFFDFDYVENSEGAHNSSLAMRCLDTADEKITEALSLLAAAGVEVSADLTAAKPEEETASDGSVTEQGFGGDVTVRAVLGEDGTIQELTIETPNETEGLGKRASEAEFIEQFIGKAGPFAFGENGIEALSGATVTSTAALTAINKAATGGTAAPAEETPAEEKTEETAPEATEAPAEEKTEETKTEETKTEKKKTEEAKTEEKPAETAAAGGQVYGSYRLTQENNFSKVTVIIGTKNGQITSCKIQSEGEQDLLTDEIRDEWAKAIVESGSAAPDAITSSTLTFSAQSVQDAVTEILAQMNGEAKAETEETTEAPAEEKTEEAKTEEKPAETAAANGQVYGSSRATKENNFSKVTVIIGTKNGQITSCKIQSEGEQDLLTDEIRDEWAKAIVESGSAAPDAITSSTLTFSAQSVQDAVTEILAQMNGEAPAAETTEKAETPAEEKTEETKAEEKPAEEAAAEPTAEPAAEPTEEPTAEPAAEPTVEPKEETVKEETAAEEKTEEPKAEEKPAEAEKPVPVFAGYRADKENDFSKVTVIVTTKSGKLADVKILSSGEQDLLTDEIRDEWAKAIVESGSAAPDAITGATLKFSAQSVQDAVTEILAQMNGEAPAAETTEKAETPAEEKTEETKAEEKPAEEAAAEPTAEPAAEPTEEPTAEPAAEPTVEPKEETVKEETAAEEKTEEPKAEEKPAEAEKPVPVFAGYRADKENDFSKVTVIVTTKSGKLADVKILSSGEQDLLTDEIRDEWAKAIVESGSAAPDAITGATLKFSAQSVQEAMTEILSEAAVPGK